MIGDDARSQVANALVTFLDMVSAAVENRFRAVTLSAQGGIRTMVYDAVEHVILDHIRKAVLDERINQSVEQYFEAGKASEALGNRLLPNEEFLFPIASFVQTQSMDATIDQ